MFNSEWWSRLLRPQQLPLMWRPWRHPKSLKENQSEFSEEQQGHASHKRIQECTVEETDVPVPHMMDKTIEVVKLSPQERVQNRTVEQIIDVPTLQIQETVEVPQVQFIDKAVDVPVVIQRQVPTVQKMQKTAEVPQVQFIDKVVDVPVIMQRQFPAVQVAKKTVKDPQTQSIVKELRSKLEVGHTNKVHARNQLDKNRWRKKHELEATQYPQDVQERADLTNQRQVPATPAEAVSESCADESDSDRFDDLVLPSLEGKTLFVIIASGDEAEDEPDKQQDMTLSLVQGEESMLVDKTYSRGAGRELVQMVHAEWVQELREVRSKFTDDMASDMSDVKNELAHVRELFGVLVRRERSAET